VLSGGILARITGNCKTSGARGLAGFSRLSATGRR
jgi:hypothetical protein